MTSDRLAIIVGAVLAVFLQLVLAPYITILTAMPNFIVVFAMIVAASRPNSYSPVLPFVLGLLYDLLTGGPVGAMAFSLTAFSYLVARLLSSLDNDTLFMPIVLMALGMLLVELAYGGFLVLLGYNVGFFQALAYRIAPCFVYNLVLGIILYLFTTRLFRQAGTIHHDITQLR